MYKGHKILAIIPARAGSKGLPNKNKLPLFGKPLIQYSIEAALQSAYVDDVVVSTDDLDIMQICSHFPVHPLLRPAELSGDLSSTQEVVKHVLTSFPTYHYFSLLQPTSPLRLPLDIDQTIIDIHDNKTSSSVTITLCKQSPSSLFTVTNSQLTRFIPKATGTSARRQDQPKFYF